jgi:crotonobetainyl-CoA:carnitine CoA-transferase CaiB-like acyl-CoA transferase
VTGIVPTNAYPCLPSSSHAATAYIVIGANGDSLYNRLMQTIERPDLTGPLYLHNNNRVEHQAEIEEAICAWTSKRSVEEVEKSMMEAGVPVGRVNSVKELVECEQVKARGAVEDVWVGGDKGWYVKMPKVFPVLEGCDAKTRWAGPDLGEHTDEVLLQDLGLDEGELAKLREDGIVG